MALPKLAHVQMTSIGAVNQSIPNQGMEECSIDTHVTSSISVAFVHDAYNGLRIKEVSTRKSQKKHTLRQTILYFIG